VTDKRTSIGDALADVRDGQCIAVGGFGDAGSPVALLEELADHSLHDLTVICNNAGGAAGGLAELLRSGAVSTLICSYPRQRGSTVFEKLYDAGAIVLEVVPQGTLVERLRCAAAGIGGFFTRTAVGTPLAEGKEVRRFDGDDYLLELPLRPDMALVRAHQADRWGNLTFSKSARNLNPVMAAAAATTVAEVNSVVALGDLDPEEIITPGVFVSHVVEVRS